MKGLILLANYFEDVEAIAPIDILKRANIKIDTVSLTDSKTIITQSNNTIVADKLVKEIDCSEYDFVILPGGKAVYETHLTSIFTKEILTYFYNNKKLICAICAAPLVLDKYHMLNNINYTCFPECVKEINEGNYINDKKVVVDSNIITSRAMGTSIDFALAIVEKFLGNAKKEEIKQKIYY